MALPARHLRTALFAVLVATATTLAAWAAGQQAQQRALREDAEQSRRQLGLYADALQALIEHYRALPAVLALDPELRSALEGRPDPTRQQQLSLKLEQVNGAATSSTLTLLDRNGQAVAASNWRRPDSNVGHDYSFRPYFRQLASQDDGRFFGVGVTTGVPGYFLSKAVRDGQGHLLGALVVKLELLGLEQEWGKGPDLVLASDAQGVIFLATRQDQRFRYHTLQTLTASQRAELQSAQQYPQQALTLLPLRPLQEVGAEGRVVRVDGPEGGSAYLWQSLSLPSEGWTLHLLRDPAEAAAAGRIASLAAAGVCLSLLFLGLFLQQRWRVARLRRRSREELEQMVRQHTAALRTAQDGLVQAAQNAAQGFGQSLEHLPQGVSVVDAQLRLLAWNRRYVELFRLPPELMRAGRPIEDILRHNARRGLLGGGDTEEAIRRRLEYLQAAQPHVFERERPDGTVLEIRGNPLPGGGFVTSYADITAYKSAARDLRTLADTLERRVEQRTGELQEAKREAERANRSKTRFVAAAVHDLQQPLNAARMFVHALGERLGGGEPAGLVRNVDEALEAQDAILSSLLDISRLESGAIRTEIRDLPLRPLLEALAREFGILAQAKGLELRWVPTRAVVRSDEALLRRILQNFLSNAVRYTRGGRVLLGCRRAGTSLRIEVWDSGPGIPEHQRQEIFEEFRRLDSGEQGAGLGLAIVDRTARLLGHTVGLRSWVGHGSVFSLTVPLGEAGAVSAAPAPAQGPAEDSALHGREVWCIDDDARVREASRVLLERWGCRVTLAAGAADGLPLARAGQAPALVLLDYRLGGGTGPELYAELERRWGASPPVILVSAERDAALQALAQARGWGFLNKPVRPPALRALMSRLLLRAAA
jgi:histidine kinase